MENQNEQNVGKVVASGIMIEERTSKKGNKYLAFVAVVTGKKKFVTYVNDETEFAFYKAGLKF
jgi:hypothetical protein